MEDLEKDSRDKKIIDLNNSGMSIGQISKKVCMSKGGVHKVLSKLLLNGDIPPKKEDSVKVKLNGTEERFDSFVGWSRLDVNEYVNDKTSEVVRVAYVRGNKGEFGYFVKLK